MFTVAGDWIVSPKSPVRPTLSYPMFVYSIFILKISDQNFICICHFPMSFYILLEEYWMSDVNIPRTVNCTSYDVPRNVIAPLFCYLSLLFTHVTPTVMRSVSMYIYIQIRDGVKQGINMQIWQWFTAECRLAFLCLQTAGSRVKMWAIAEEKGRNWSRLVLKWRRESLTFTRQELYRIGDKQFSSRGFKFVMVY
jgi:hypothetical protein